MLEHLTWLNLAQDSLKTAKILFSNQEPMLLHTAYHSHQCAKKTLKSFLTYYKHRIEHKDDL